MSRMILAKGMNNKRGSSWIQGKNQTKREGRTGKGRGSYREKGSLLREKPQEKGDFAVPWEMKKK